MTMLQGRKNSWFVLVMILAVSLSLVASGCGQQTETSSSSQAKKPIQIGVIEPLSGPVADSGQNVVWGAQIATKFINADGGILGRPLSLKVYDSKNDPAQAVDVANRLITSDNVKVMMGAWGSSPTLAILPIIEKAGVPLVNETGSSPKITGSGYKYVFSISPTSNQEADGIIDQLMANVKPQRVAIIAVNNDWGQGGAKAYTKVLTEKGVKVVNPEYVSDSATDFYPQLTNIKNSGADTILINSDVGQIALIVKQIRELGMKQKIVTVGGSNFSDALISLAKNAAEGVYSVQQNVAWIPDMTPNPGLATKYDEEWQAEKRPHIGILEAAKGFDGIYTIAEAIKKAGTVDSKKIQEALRTLQYKGIGLDVKFDANGQSKIKVYLVQVVDGKTVLVK